MLLASHLQVTFRRTVKVSRLQSLPAQGQLEAWSRCCNFCAQREASQVATVLLSTLLLAAPAFARASSSEYISVQDRVRQRSPLQKKKSAGLIDSVETAPDPQLKALSIPQQVAEVQQLSAAAVDAIAAADYAQSGRTTDAVLEMEGEEEELRGLAEVHAALAAMFYSESPKQISRAETQWEIAREFDQRYANLDWVKHEKHWPPAMQTALGNFLSLR